MCKPYLKNLVYRSIISCGLKFSFYELYLPMVPYPSSHKLSIIFQTDQMKRIGNELDSVHFSLKKASQMVKEIGRQVLSPCPYMSLFGICEETMAETCNICCRRLQLTNASWGFCF